jgi:glutamate dehydrogenase
LFGQRGQHQDRAGFAKRAARLTEEERVALLSSMTDEVAHLVLEDNRLQALALSIAQRAARRPCLVARLMDVLEEAGDLDRKTEGLASAEDFARRATSGQGLTRPELAVLLSSTKLVCSARWKTARWWMIRRWKTSCSPRSPPMRERFREDITGHRLRREIIATKLANRLVNRLGPVNPFELAEEEGVTLAQVAAASPPPNACSTCLPPGRCWTARRWPKTCA